MYAIISGLDQSSLEKVNEIRRLILEQCPPREEPVKLEAHLSWQGADDYPLEILDNSLSDLARQVEPIKVLTGGLGIFTGDEPVLHLNVSKSPRLMDLHYRIWQILHPIAIGPNMYFSPETWIPHITLYYGDRSTAQTLVCGLGKLIDKKIELEITIDHLALAYYKNEIYGIKNTYPFRKNH